MSQVKIPFTQEGYDRAVAELERLRNVERPNVILAIQEARAQGDLSENAEYDAAKEKQGQIEARLHELEDKIARAVIIKADTAASETVVFGAQVTVVDKTLGKEIVYTLVGPEDVDLLQNRISISSPIGKALIGKRKGDTVEVQTPRGLKQLLVKEFR
jgi:transcription elongation factor GreA